MTSTTHSTRAAWEDLVTPAEFAADCQIARSRISVPAPRQLTETRGPAVRFSELSGLAAAVAYDID